MSNKESSYRGLQGRMQRPIKFRAWLPNNKQMLYKGSLMDLWGYNWLYKGGLAQAIPMQYTGLSDKNGKEIYEGDIIRISNWHAEYKCGKCGYSPKSEGIAKVIWVNETYYGDRLCSVARFNYEIGIDSYEFDEAEKCEVIGNIWENGELLEAKNEAHIT